MRVDFLIVGGGIGGGVLAHLLARQGRRVLVLEKDAVPKPMVRPEVLWPATLRALATVVPPERLDDAVVPVAGIVVRRRGRTLLDFRLPPTPPAYRVPEAPVSAAWTME